MFKDLGSGLGRLMSKRLIAYVILAIVVFLLFFWRLGSLVPGLSPQEALAKASSQNLQFIFNHPVDAPHRLLQYMFLKLSPESFAALRLSSAIIACIIGLFFYKLASLWFGKLIGLFGSLIFITMPLFMVAGRQGTSQIMLFTPVILMSLYAWMVKTERFKAPAWVLLVIAAAMLAYTPGLIWFIIISLIVTHKRLVASIADVPQWVSGTVLAIATLLLVPLALSFVNHPDTIKHAFLIPNSWPPVLQVLKNIAWMGLALFIKAPDHNPLILDHLPLINVLVLALTVFGVYAMQAAARAKAAWLGGSVLLAVVAAGINNNIIYLALCLPALCLLASAGLRYLYIEWRSIFPRNPVPKTFALVLIAAVTLSQIYFGVRYSLVAWPHSMATRATYVLK